MHTPDLDDVFLTLTGQPRPAGTASTTDTTNTTASSKENV